MFYYPFVAFYDRDIGEELEDLYITVVYYYLLH